ncbi:hypothetical protein IW15_14945 [Chryseobacterium soli]|uniref:Uncharacterized protein n=1 Tax=Chryseobacterium soli TaxID=445961 RepID=A0A086A495_9FLAO|nr:hypothetical protein [Chryseobacterium soli]KFF11509.1 hypothetical protein IW15_14945 [Chryseobacterium soli]
MKQKKEIAQKLSLKKMQMIKISVDNLLSIKGGDMSGHSIYQTDTVPTTGDKTINTHFPTGNEILNN